MEVIECKKTLMLTLGGVRDSSVRMSAALSTPMLTKNERRFLSLRFTASCVQKNRSVPVNPAHIRRQQREFVTRFQEGLAPYVRELLKNTSLSFSSPEPRGSHSLYFTVQKMYYCHLFYAYLGGYRLEEGIMHERQISAMSVRCMLLL